MPRKDFDCPSCAAPMKFGGGESIFQTCKSCNAPIVIPSDIFYPSDQQIASGNFATLTKDVGVDPELVTNELTPGSKPPRRRDLIDSEAKIEKFEVYQEKIGASGAESKRTFDNIVNPGKSNLDKTENKSVQATGSIPESESALERIKRELLTGDKIEAIKIYRKKFGKSLAEAKDIVEAIEREELARVKSEK